MTTIPFPGGSATVDDQGISVQSSDGGVSVHVGADGASASAGGATFNVGKDGARLDTPVGSVSVGPDGIQVEAGSTIRPGLPAGTLILEVSKPIYTNASLKADGKLEGKGHLDAEAKLDAQAKMDAQAKLSADAKVDAQAKVDANAKLAADAKVDANAKLAADGDLRLGFSTPVQAILSGDPKHPVTADVTANIGGTGKPFELKVSPNLPNGKIRFAMPRVELALRLFGFKIFSCSIEVDGHVHLESGGGPGA